MIIVGFLILVVVVLATLAALFRGGASVKIDLELFTVRTDAAVIFFAGVLSLLLALLGLWLMSKGMKRGRRRRSEIKGLRKRAETSEEAARREHEAADARAAEADESPSTQHRPDEGPDDYFDTAPREG